MKPETLQSKMHWLPAYMMNAFHSSQWASHKLQSTAMLLPSVHHTFYHLKAHQLTCCKVVILPFFLQFSINVAYTMPSIATKLEAKQNVTYDLHRLKTTNIC